MAKRVLVRNAAGITMYAPSNRIPPGFKKVSAGREAPADKYPTRMHTPWASRRGEGPRRQAGPSDSFEASAMSRSRMGQTGGRFAPTTARVGGPPPRPPLPPEPTQQRSPIGGVDPSMRSAYPGGSDMAKLGTTSGQRFMTSRGEIGRYGAGPLYFEGDEFNLRSWPAERLAEMQRRLAQAGLLEGRFRLGAADAATLGAYKNLLAQANMNGTTWTQMLDNLRSSPSMVAEDGEITEGEAEDEYTRNAFVSDIFLAPDIDTLHQAIKEVYRDRLRRDPTAEELSNYSEDLAASARAEFDIDQQVSRAQFEAEEDARQAQFMGEEPGEINPEVPEGLEAEDPTASFWERWEEENQGELGNITQQDTAVLGRENIERTMSSFDRLIGSGR